jgi:Fe-S oxidoreductase
VEALRPPEHMTPTRQVYFNIQHIWAMYALYAVSLGIFAWGVYRRWQRWSMGRAAHRFDRPWQRIVALFRQTAVHEKLLKRYRAAGIFHLLFYWSFLALLAGTTVVFIHQDLGLRIMQGSFYLWFQSLALDVFGAFFIIAILVAIYYRYGKRAARLKPDKVQDGLILGLLLLILVTGFVIEGARIQLTADQWAHWSPVGNATGEVLTGLFSNSIMWALHRGTWWLHAVIVFGFIAWIPYSKLFHLLTAPANIYLQDLGPKGALPSIELETAENLGISRLNQFTWKDLLDYDACTECGRCEVNCPAFLTQKPLSPKKFILDLRDAMHSTAVAPPTNGSADGQGSLIGAVIQEETLWSCTSCRACMEQCPVMIEQVPKIMNMRRHLVMEQAEFPADLQNAVRSLEARGHPFPGVSSSRSDWHADLAIPVLAEQPDTHFDVLLWVGCAGALNERNKSVTRAVAQLLKQAGVKFAILSREERCTGDPARRIGHEFLFQTLAQQNVATFARHNIKKIVTACPHCFNTLRNEYPQLGGNYEVVHHSEFLQELVAAGRLKPQARGLNKVVFHDPCYLGRYNDVYDAPRDLLECVPGAQRVEVDGWNRRNALCCGGGGGFSFMEEKLGFRMNKNRSEQLLATGAGTVAVGCPFCMVMIDDGIKTAAADPAKAPEVLDIAEVLVRATAEVHA